MIDEKVDDPKSGQPASNTQINRVSIEPFEFSEATAAGCFFIIESQLQLAQMNVSSCDFQILTQCWQHYQQNWFKDKARLHCPAKSTLH